MAARTVWEHELTRRLTAHDETALTELYDQLGDFVYGLAARVTARRLQEVAGWLGADDVALPPANLRATVIDGVLGRGPPEGGDGENDPADADSS
jgi:hypothetical protein